MSDINLRRISIRGGKFTLVVDGTEVSTDDSGSIEVVVVNAAPVSRSFYGDAYDPNRVAVPTCWSSDTQLPSREVPQDQRQAMRCMDCPQNIRGSGQYGGRACRFAQRLAVVFGDKPDEVYQLQVPAASIFGNDRGGAMGMQNYARLLSKHDTPIVAITTKIYFDKDSVVPKLYFKPVDRLDADTYEAVCEMIDHEDTLQAITLTVPVTSQPVSPFSVVEGFELNAN
tara:strand:+ start:267 stop:947 length:681 start_codon:yes stop_codon:yes gene_type:complete